MTYIIEIYTPGIDIDITTATYLYFDNLDDAIDIATQYKNCHGCDIGINIYSAINEYDAKRQLLKTL